MGDIQPDYYTIIGVSRTATQEEIRAKYFELAKKYHGDLYQNTATKDLADKEMQKIIEAYNIIGDPNKRKEYDKKASKTTSIVNVGKSAVSSIDKFLNNEMVANRVGKMTQNVGWNYDRMMSDMDKTFGRQMPNTPMSKPKKDIKEKKGESAMSILKKRYAKGEITKSQYNQMKKELE